VEFSNVQILVERLSGLCENSREVVSEPFRVREVVFRRKVEEDPTGGAVPLVMGSELRVQCRYLPDDRKQWSLHYNGTLVSRENLFALAKPVLEIEVGENIEIFLEQMDYKYVTARYHCRCVTLIK